MSRPIERRAAAALKRAPVDDREAYVADQDEADDDMQCERCRGDGRDPWCDYLLPCPECQGTTA